MYPEAIYQAGRRQAAEQYAAAAGQPVSSILSASGLPTSSRSEQSNVRRGARKFAEDHPEIVNHYASCNGSCGKIPMRDSERALDRRWDGQNMLFAPGARQTPPNHQRSTSSPHYNTFDFLRSSDYEHGQLCTSCQNYSHPRARDYAPYEGGPPLMGVPGRDGLLHHESCIHVQPRCRCSDCKARRTGDYGSPRGSYVRERAGDWVREV